MTPEERAREIEIELQLIEIQEEEEANALELAKSSAPQEAKGQGWSDTIEGGIHSANQGLFLGWGDEIAGAGRALAEKFLPTEADRIADQFADNRQSFGESAEMYRSDYEDNRAQFGKENPGTAFGLELAGGIASPANIVGGATGGGLAKTAARAAARGGVEGAIAGAGANSEDRLGGAMTGGFVGGLSGAALSGGVGGLGRAVSKRRIANDLVDEATGEFTPIHMQPDENLTTDLHRNTLGRAFGARQVLKDQERPFLDAASEGLDEAKRWAKTEKNAITKGTEEIAERFDAATAKAARIADQKGEGLSKAKQYINKELDDAAEREAGDFRAFATQEAVPTSFREEVLRDVDPGDIPKARAAVQDFWKNKAFKEVKDTEFNWDTNLKNEVREAFAEDADLLINFRKQLGAIDDIEKVLGLKPASPGKALTAGDSLIDVKVPGEVLMDMRNTFAGSKNRGHKVIKDKFDRLITDQLSPNDAGRYIEQMEVYPTYKSYEKASRKRMKMKPDHYVSAHGQAGRADDAVTLKADEIYQAQQSRLKKAKQFGDEGKNQTRENNRLLKAAKAKAKADRKAETKALNKRGRTDAAEGRIAMAREAKQEMDKRSVPANTSGLSEFFTTRTLGSMLGSSALMIPNVVTGGLVAKGLASKPAQKFAAGQLKKQIALSDLLRKGDSKGATALRNARNTLARERARENQEEEEKYAKRYSR